MDWLRINKDLPRHPKAKALARRLGERVSWWRIAQVWAWAVDYAKDGVVRGPDAELDVEEAAGWEGDAGRFIEAAITTGFLERVDGGLSIHDWMEHNGKALAAAAAEAERKRKMRRPADVHGTSAGRPADEVQTSSVDETRRRRDEELPASQAPAPAAPPLQLESPPVPEKPRRERKASAQEALWGRMQVLRAEACPGSPPDPGLKPAALNAKLGELLDPGHFGGEGPLLEAYRAFLADQQWARTLNPPCPLSAFVAQWAKYAAAAQRNQQRAAAAEASTARAPPEVACASGCGRPAAYSPHEGHRVCLTCLGIWLQGRKDAGAPILGEEARADLGRWLEAKRADHGRAA